MEVEQDFQENYKKLYAPPVQFIPPKEITQKQKSKKSTKAKKSTFQDQKLKLGKNLADQIDNIHESQQLRIYEKFQEKIQQKMKSFLKLKTKESQICMVNIVKETTTQISKLKIKDCFEKCMQMKRNKRPYKIYIVKLENDEKNLKSILTLINDNMMLIKKEMRKKQTDPRQFYFCFICVEEFLNQLDRYQYNDLIKYISEEYKNEPKIAFFIFNWNNMLVHQTYANCYNISTLDLGFDSNYKLTSELFYELIKNQRFFPLISQDIILNFQNNLMYFEQSIDETKKRVKLMTHLFLHEINSEQDIEALYKIVILNVKNPERLVYSSNNELLEKPWGKLLSDLQNYQLVVEFFDIFLYKLFDFQDESNHIDLIMNILRQPNKKTFLLPERVIQKIKSQGLQVICEVIQEILEYKQFVKKQNIQEIGIKLDKILKQKDQNPSKQNKRMQALIGQNHVNKSQLEEQKLNKVISLLRTFVQIEIIDQYAQIMKNYPFACFNKKDLLYSRTKPDIYAQLFNYLKNEKNIQSNSSKSVERDKFLFFQSLCDFDERIPIHSVYEQFKNQLEEGNQRLKIQEEDVKKRFITQVQEFQNLGLIVENKHQREFFYKQFFAKTYFQNYSK